MSTPSGTKRPPEDDDSDTSSTDGDLGPALPSASDPSRPRKKRRVLKHEQLYLAALPAGTRYSKSLMHKDQLAFTIVTPQTEFLITAGIDGQVSFWKKSKVLGEVDFVKEFRAHGGGNDGSEALLRSVAVSWDGRLFASAGNDKTVKIWDVVTFDLVTVIRLRKQPTCIAWIHGRGSPNPLLAVGNTEDGEIVVYDGNGAVTSSDGVDDPLYIPARGKLHRQPVVAIAYNARHDTVVSADASGMVEYWRPGAAADKPSADSGIWTVKSTTQLFEFRKAKSAPTCIIMSPSGDRFATFSLPDRAVRVFDFASGRIHRQYDESLQTLAAMQQAGTSPITLEASEFARRMATERDLEAHLLASPTAPIRARLNLAFDESGHFLLVPSALGIKLLNLTTNRVSRVYAAEEPLRPLNVAVYQGAPDRRDLVTVEMAASENPLLREAEARDALLVCTAMGKVRFYMFSNTVDIDKTSRDVQNERPRAIGKGGTSSLSTTNAPNTATSAIMHTTLGDIHLRLFPDAAPKTVENFITHARRGYYNDILFHRVIRKFMIQTGDPMGDGTGGESIWGGEFEDEFSTLKHDKPYTLSMANAGPNTNGSQFFITTEKTPWLDGKHTIFGRAVKGMDVVHRIENVRTNKERPVEDVKIVNVEVGSD